MEADAGRAASQADQFVLGGLEFVSGYDRPSESGSLTLAKAIDMVDAYERLLAPYPNPRIVELGIWQGGSVALLALLSEPEMLVALDLSPEPIEPLLEVIRERGLTDTVKPYFGVDQADKARLVEILTADFGGAMLDVVIDDASHLYEQTVASFEVLFPRLRPGGVYVIEDWRCDDLHSRKMVSVLAEDSPRRDRLMNDLESRLAEVLADPDSPHHERLVTHLARPMGEAPQVDERDSATYLPLSRLALDLALARADSGGAVADLHLDDRWIVVHRGDVEIDPDGFRIGDLAPDPYGQLVARPARTLA